MEENFENNDTEVLGGAGAAPESDAAGTSTDPNAGAAYTDPNAGTSYTNAAPSEAESYTYGSSVNKSGNTAGYQQPSGESAQQQTQASNSPLYQQNPYQNPNPGQHQDSYQNQYQNQQQYQTQGHPEGMDESPLSLGEWLLTLLAAMIPCAGLILYFVWAFGKNGNINRRNFCRASLIMQAIGLVITLIFMIFIVVLGVSVGGSGSTYYY